MYQHVVAYVAEFRGLCRLTCLFICLSMAFGLFLPFFLQIMVLWVLVCRFSLNVQQNDEVIWQICLAAVVFPAQSVSSTVSPAALAAFSTLAQVTSQFHFSR